MKALDVSILDALYCRERIAHAFKYMEAKYADELVNDGKLRIGTLLDYRRREKFGGGRLDEDEGTSELWAAIDARSNDDIPEFARSIIQIGPSATKVHISGIGVVKPYLMPDAYVLCLSKRYAPAELLPDFEPADACVEIVNPPEFFAALEDSMAAHGQFIGVHDCKYSGRRVEYPAPALNPFVVKDPRYAHQAESRIGWLPHKRLKSTFIDIVNPELRNWCRRIL